jgi:hypothetical protein
MLDIQSNVGNIRELVLKTTEKGIFPNFSIRASSSWGSTKDSKEKIDRFVPTPSFEWATQKNNIVGERNREWYRFLGCEENHKF